MKNLIKGLFILATAFAAPTILSAHCDNHEHHHCFENGTIHAITTRDVAGTYQINGFSNSRDGAGTLLFPQSQAAVGQLTFFEDGTGIANFVDFVAIIGGQLTPISRENVPFIWALDPLHNGRAFVQIFNFPAPGLNPTFVLSFKLHEGCVTGFSGVTAANSATGLWTLLQGERFH